MTNINKMINRYVRGKIERGVLEAYLMQIGAYPMIADMYLGQADRRKAKRYNDQAQFNSPTGDRRQSDPSDTQAL